MGSEALLDPGRGVNPNLYEEGKGLPLDLGYLGWRAERELQVRLSFLFPLFLLPPSVSEITADLQKRQKVDDGLL
jgi:hypothetical protein